MPRRALVLAFAAAALLGAGPAPAQSPNRGGGSFEDSCSPPLKFAAGACVPRCPAGYDDRGRFCAFRSMSSGGGGGAN